MLKRIREYVQSDELTQEQRDVCAQEGSFVVRACPGSGKTRTTGTLLALKIAGWTSRRSGIAALSFTNVAKNEIGAQLRKLGINSEPGWPHFLGTIDSFVNQAIFLPFGHLIMGCRERPEVVHPSSPNHNWIRDDFQHRLNDCRQRGCSPLSFTFEANGALKWCGEKPQPKCDQRDCNRLKQVMVKAGFASPPDAMYWGMKALDSVPLRRAIASRYPEIIVDEAQDTSEVQFRILELLSEAGSHIILIGDPDQAIFGFSGARPDLFEKFMKALPVLNLSSNFRSSQLICDIAALFANAESQPYQATGKDKQYPAKPILWKYRPGSERLLVKAFQTLTEAHDLAVSDCAILARKHTTLQSIGGRKVKTWPKVIRSISRTFARAATLRDSGDLSEAHKVVMWGLLRLCFDKASFGINYGNIQPIGIRIWRRQSWKLLKQLPAANTTCADWGPKIRSTVEKFLAESGLPCVSTLSVCFCKCNGKEAGAPVSDFCSVLPSNAEQYLVVHQVKGMTFGAVLMVAAASKKGRLSDVEQWLGADRDEQRVAYVGVTRPRKLLVLAVPENTAQELLTKLAQNFEVCDCNDTPAK